MLCFFYHISHILTNKFILCYTLIKHIVISCWFIFETQLLHFDCVFVCFCLPYSFPFPICCTCGGGAMDCASLLGARATSSSTRAATSGVSSTWRQLVEPFSRICIRTCYVKAWIFVGFKWFLEDGRLFWIMLKKKMCWTYLSQLGWKGLGHIWINPEPWCGGWECSGVYKRLSWHMFETQTLNKN